MHHNLQISNIIYEKRPKKNVIGPNSNTDNTKLSQNNTDLNIRYIGIL